MVTPARILAIVTMAIAACGGEPASVGTVTAAVGSAPPGTYRFAPVRLGAGGFVTGFVTHPLDAKVRYARTDVGNAYRWDESVGRWMPMKVANDDGSGVPASAAPSPASLGEDSVAVDPSDPSIVYLAFPTNPSNDVGGGKGENIYRSADGGRSFTAGDLDLPADPNGATRALGERLAVDPANGKVIYFGSPKSGLYGSLDSGSTWRALSGAGAPSSDANIINVLPVAKSGTTTRDGQTVTRVVYAVAAGGDVYQTQDGGGSWSNLSTGTALSGRPGMSSVDGAGALYVAEAPTASDYAKAYFKYAAGQWSRVDVALDQAVQNVIVDPARPARLFASGIDGGLARSIDGGAHWTNLGSMHFANTLGWTPETLGSTWRSTGGIALDHDGVLWSCQGNEGTLRYTPSDSDTAASWTIDSAGIEELVTHDVILPKGSGDHAIVTVEDATALTVTDPDLFTAKQVPLQDQLISDGYGIAACPDAPEFIVVSSSDINFTGSAKNYSGFSTDGGGNWKRFGSVPHIVDSNGMPQTVHAGSIAVSRRDGRKLGEDHLVMVPNYGQTAYYSKDGGDTWTPTASFPTNADGTLGAGFAGIGNVAFKSRQLEADPFVADRFYLKWRYPAALFVSNDGGVTWNPAATTLPDQTFHGQLALNKEVAGDLWFADGWEGATTHGLWHSKDGGASFDVVSVFTHAITIALGKGDGVTGDAPYTVYVYGKRGDDPAWGVFRSRDDGATWERIARYPAGIFDQPTSMAASWDTFGLLYIGFNGNSFVYGKILQSDVAHTDGGIPTGNAPSAVDGGSRPTEGAEAGRGSASSSGSDAPESATAGSCRSSPRPVSPNKTHGESALLMTSLVYLVLRGRRRVRPPLRGQPPSGAGAQGAGHALAAQFKIRKMRPMAGSFCDVIPAATAHGPPHVT